MLFFSGISVAKVTWQVSRSINVFYNTNKFVFLNKRCLLVEIQWRSNVANSTWHQRCHNVNSKTVRFLIKNQ